MSRSTRPLIWGYHLIGGDSDKGNRWCYALGTERAKTVYRNIGKRPRRGMDIQVLAILHEIGQDDEFWTKQPHEPSRSHQFKTWREEEPTGT